jgi:hypothetical protein
LRMNLNSAVGNGHKTIKPRLNATADGSSARTRRAMADGIERSKEKVREWFHSRTA